MLTRPGASLPNLPERVAAIVGASNVLADPEAMEPYLHEPREKFLGQAALVARPGATQEVSQILALASESRIGVVAQSGNTGLVGGQVPSGNQIVLSLERLSRIRDIDPTDNTLVAEAGVTLAGVQEAAREAGRLFPLSLASEGSCRIGGNLATNAGGVGVLAYGNARDLCLGLEVVLADGRIWDGLRRLRKDNTGYDLKDLFIGSEGTLGIITAAVLKLFPSPAQTATAWIGLASAKAALALLNLSREQAGQRITVFELVPRIGVEFTMRHAATRDPLGDPHAWYVLLELSGGEGAPLEETMESLLGAAMELGLVQDAAIAASQAQAGEFWRIREALSEVQKHEGGSIKHDVSIPVSKVPEFLARATAAVEALVPGARPVPFGHLGDGNIHFNVSQPTGTDRKAYLDRWEEMNETVHAVVLDLGGSISAEHGIGQLKRNLMPHIKSPVELDLMRMLKRTLDPNGILNPGKLLPDP